jgi:DNA polymerase I
MLLPQYTGIVVWDFEFRPDADHRQSPVCATFLELRSGERVELWGEFGAHPPFPTSGDWLWISYHASAETHCHLALGWPIPETIVDLEGEFRCETTNYTVDGGKGLPAAMRVYGLSWSDALEKPAMIKLIVEGGPEYTAAERRQIMDYCWLDTEGLAALLPRILPDILARPNGWEFALIRGYYSGHCIAHMEWDGIPLDIETYRRLDQHWDDIRARLVAQYDPEFGVYDGLRFVVERFINYLVREDIAWPEHASGVLDLRDETFKDMGLIYPQIERLRQLRSTMAKMRLSSITLGADGRNRALLGQFVASTGRNAHQAGKLIFGPSRWLRGLIKPPRGSVIAYLDWASQEFIIAAALSNDSNMLRAIASGDPYLWLPRWRGSRRSGRARKRIAVSATCARRAASARCTAWATGRWPSGSDAPNSRPGTCWRTIGASLRPSGPGPSARSSRRRSSGLLI